MKAMYWLFNALLVCTLGCELPRTQVLVRVYADQAVQERMGSLSLDVWANDSRWRERLGGEAVPSEELVWPVELALIPEGDEGALIEVTATARTTTGETVVFDRALARFRERETRVLVLDLRVECAARRECGDPTCHGEECSVCRIENDVAVCGPAHERSTETFTRTDYIPSAPRSEAMPDGPIAVATLGERCAREGERACQDRASRARVVCERGMWVDAGACEAENVCDARRGPSQGTCLAACSEGPAEVGRCLSEAEREVCSADGVWLAHEICEQGAVCIEDDAGGRCQDIDECAREPTLCAPGTCIDVPGGYRCECPRGYAGERQCLISCDEEFCAPGSCFASEIGDLELCSCPTGYELEGDACLDVDECARDTPCASACRNDDGSYACACGDQWCDAMTERCVERGGVAWCDTLDIGWPIPNTDPGAPNQASYRVLADGTVEDMVTGLEWLARTETGTWREASDTCATLVIGTHDDFRLPSVIELVSIVDSHQMGPARNLVLGRELDWVEWSRDRSLQEGVLYARTVHFDTGEKIGFIFEGDVCAYRCVRGPLREPPAPRWVIDDQLATDRATHLMWLRAPWHDLLTHSNAARYCATRVVGDFDDFRLPTSKELLSLFDAVGHEHPGIFTQDLDEYESTWSSSCDNDENCLLVSWTDGPFWIHFDYEAEAVCVRTLP